MPRGEWGLEQKRSLPEISSSDWPNHRRPHQALGWQTPDSGVLWSACVDRGRGGVTRLRWHECEIVDNWLR